MNKKILVISIFLTVFNMQSFASSSLEEETMKKSCSYLSENIVVNHCLNEQRDELLIKQTNGKGLEYLNKNSSTTINKIKTPIGLQHFVNELEKVVLSPSILEKSDLEQKNELRLVTEIHTKLKNKNNQFKKFYTKSLSDWSVYKNDDKEIESGVKKFALNRIELNNNMQKTLTDINHFVKDKDLYLKVKRVNRDLVLPLYLNNKISVSKGECEIIKQLVPNLLEQKSKNVEGCE